MIVRDLDLKGIVCAPNEAYPPLVIDADRMLPGAIPFQPFQTIPRRGTQILECAGVVQHPEFPQRRALDLLRELLREKTLIDSLGFLVLEGLDHNESI